MFVVTVTFRLHPGTQTAFLKHMLANAAQSLGAEPERHQFDVCTDPARLMRCFYTRSTPMRMPFRYTSKARISCPLTR